MEELVSKIRELQAAEHELRENEKLLSDPELREVAEPEIAELKTKISNLQSKIQALLLPRDPMDEKNAIMEIRGRPEMEDRSHFQQPHRHRRVQGSDI